MTDPQNVEVTVAMTEIKIIEITFRLCTRGRNNSYDISAEIAEVETIDMTFPIRTRGIYNSYIIAVIYKR
jgi:hypothetical protein